MDYDTTLEHLYRLERFGIKLGLDNIRRLLSLQFTSRRYAPLPVGLSPNSELRRQTHGQRRVAPRCELQGLPVQVAEVQRTIQRAAGVQIEPQISPMHGDGSLRVVVEDPPVSQYQAPDAQSE